MNEIVNLLDRDLYTMSQADRLLGLSVGTSRRWINGYARNGKQHDPLVREFPTDSEMVTWGEFVEARLISEYRRQGVTVFRMRPAIMALRQEYRANYPLAMAQPFLSAENRELVMEIQHRTNLDPALRFVIRSGQLILPSLELMRFQSAADYSEDSDQSVVQRFQLSRNIVLDPKYSSGEPTVRGRRLRVDTITEAIVSGMSPENVADTWKISIDTVEEAVRCSQIA